MGLKEAAVACFAASMPFFAVVIVAVCVWRCSVRSNRKKRKANGTYWDDPEAAMTILTASVGPAPRDVPQVTTTREALESPTPERVQQRALHENERDSETERATSRGNENHDMSESNTNVLDTSPASGDAVVSISDRNAIVSCSILNAESTAHETIHEETEWMRGVDQFVAASIAAGEIVLLRKALVLGDLGVNDSLHLKNGHTALHIAASHGQRRVCLFLVEEAGADVLTCDSLGRTPFDLAVACGHAEIAEELASFVHTPLTLDPEGSYDDSDLYRGSDLYHDSYHQGNYYREEEHGYPTHNNGDYPPDTSHHAYNNNHSYDNDETPLTQARTGFLRHDSNFLDVRIQ